MMPEMLTLRAAIAQAGCLLADKTRERSVQPGATRTRPAGCVTLDTTAALSPADRAALDDNPVVQAALARLATSDEVYLLTGSDGGPSDELLEPTGDERPVGPGELERLGL